MPLCGWAELFFMAGAATVGMDVSGLTSPAMPVATTVTRSLSPMLSSKAVPNTTVASGLVKLRMIDMTWRISLWVMVSWEAVM